MATARVSERSRVDDRYGPSGRSEWLDIDWSEHQRWIDVKGLPVNVIELGEGPPIVFIHGHSGCWQNWLETLPHFARSHRVIAIDLPGFGSSPMPRWPITIENYAGCIDALCDQLEIDVATVVGNSMGGFVGAELAIKFGVRVERLVLVSAAGLAGRYLGLFTLEMMRRPALGAAHDLLARVTQLPPHRTRVLMRRPALRRAALGMVFAHAELISPGICAETLRGHGKPAARYATRAIATYDFRDRLADITCSTLIVWGASDRVVPVKGADRYARTIPHARAEIFEDTGHVPMLERPARFNALLEEFLAEPLRAGEPVAEAAEELARPPDDAEAAEPLSR